MRKQRCLGHIRGRSASLGRAKRTCEAAALGSHAPGARVKAGAVGRAARLEVAASQRFGEGSDLGERLGGERRVRALAQVVRVLIEA